MFSTHYERHSTEFRLIPLDPFTHHFGIFSWLSSLEDLSLLTVKVRDHSQTHHTR